MLKNDNKYRYKVIFNNLTAREQSKQPESKENGLKSTLYVENHT